MLGKKKYRFIMFFLFLLALPACKQGAPSVIAPPSTTVEPSEQCQPNCSSELFKTEKILKTFKQAPTDILFVLDESCSMSAIATAMKDGFATIQGGDYPENTKMGVTYMSPAWVNEDSSIDYGKTWHKNASVHLPGYLRLVSDLGIQDYSTAFPDNASYFPKKGCDNEWFEPSETNVDGDSCLAAAVQLAPVCTGAEAGLVSLEQLLSYKTLNNERLFRDKAFVNIILVSDTHEPGANYWGKEGSPQNQRDVESVISMVHANSPGVSSIKFGGILPVPKVGHSYLEGLKVIGDIPQTDEEAKVGSEQFWDYSYLPLIKSFNGAVAHAKGNSWGGVADSLVKDSKYTGSIFVELSQKIKKVVAVRVNGQTLAQGSYFIGFDRKSLNLRYAASVDETVSIEVDYEE